MTKPSKKNRVESLPEVKIHFTVGQLISLISALIVIISTIAFSYYNLTAKLDKLDSEVQIIKSKTETMSNQIQHESNLRKIISFDDYFGAGDSSGRPTFNFDSVLVYDPITDTLIYKKRIRPNLNQ